MATCGTIGFTVSSLATQLHGFPHKNRNLKTVSDVFDPTSFTYIEGVFFSAGLFLIIGFILMAFVCVYLCVRACCCKGEPGSGKRRGCNPIFMIVCVLFAGGGLVLGYYGNEFTRDGLLGIADSVISANGTVSGATRRVNGVTSNLTNSSGLLNRLNTEIAATTLNPQLKAEITSRVIVARDQVSDAATQSGDISSNLDNIPNVAKYANTIKDWEGIRWKSTIGVLCYILFILLLAILCILCKSSCFLQFNVFLTLLALLVAWLYGGVFIGVGVFSGDFCVDANGYVERAVSNSSREQIIYFTRCGNCSNPFQQDYDDARSNVLTSLQEVRNLTGVLQEQNDTSTGAAEGTLGDLQFNLQGVDNLLVELYDNDINCTNINSDYNHLLTAACTKTLEGAVFTMSGCFVLGVMLVLFIIAMQLYWTRLKDDSDGW